MVVGAGAGAGAGAGLLVVGRLVGIEVVLVVVAFVVLPTYVAAVADLAEQQFGAGVGAALLEGAGVAGGGDGGEGVEDLVDGVGVGGGDGGAPEA